MAKVELEKAITVTAKMTLKEARRLRALLRDVPSPDATDDLYVALDAELEKVRDIS